MPVKPSPDPVIAEPDSVTASRPGYLTRTHPLASVAAQHCARHAGRAHLGSIGGVACGACWERAIRDDERTVVAFDLPPVLKPDPSYVDRVAVELACQGYWHPLTPAELAEAVRRLAAQGLGPNRIAARLSLSYDKARSILAGLASAVPFLPAPPDGTAAPLPGDAGEVAS